MFQKDHFCTRSFNNQKDDSHFMKINWSRLFSTKSITTKKTNVFSGLKIL